MELIKLTHDNIDQEHICCAISSNKDVQVMSKKAWLEERMDEGLVFLKGNVRGKCFIEYIPAEYAWTPIEAEGYIYIDCLWVSGQLKGHGYSSLLLDTCIEDSKAKKKKGLVILSARKKLGFLSDPGYIRHKGFVTADTAKPYFELLYLPFEERAEGPASGIPCGSMEPCPRDLCSITPTSARLRQSMCRCWSAWQRNGTPFSSLSISRPERMPRTLPRPLPPSLYSMTANW